MGFLVLSIR